MARVGFWHPKEVEDVIIENAMQRLEQAGEIVAQKARSIVPVGTKSRPMYQTGRYAGCEWTKRDAGALKKTIRVVRKNGDPNLNIWIMAGNKVTYYAQIVEFYTPFLRRALGGSKAAIRSALGVGKTVKG